MAVFKCKMCGGAMQITDQVFGQCPFCGTTQTFPKLDDERRAQMYDRANQFRRENEFDKAQGIYEQILSEEPTDAEAYWSIVLCTYGIEYVDDPRTHKKVPTVNRAQFTSIFADKNYLAAIDNADNIQKPIYENEAKIIDEIQKGILEVSSKEEPFDVFICYKETDESGLRTQDSVFAYDIYDALREKGYKVFFSRVTLENKLGTAYEPYIFAALNSAKVMIVVGTKKEYFNAVWVKNEWARFISLMKGDKSRHLIPVYKDLDPTDLPDEFAYLQAQDMNKIGFIQDVVHGIEKLIPKQPIADGVNGISFGANLSVEPLIKRAFMFIEDNEWDNANIYCEKVLDQDPENAMAYVCKLLVDYKCNSINGLGNLKVPFTENVNYKRAIQFGDMELVNLLKKNLDEIVAQIAKKEKEKELTVKLQHSIIESDLVAVEELINLGADVNAKVKWENCTSTFLIGAVSRSDLEMVKLLISKGADPNGEKVYKDGRHFCALRYSIADSPNDEIAAILIEAGADVNYVEKLISNNISYMIPILTNAIEQSNENMVRLLLSKGANPNCERIIKKPDRVVRYSALRDSIVEWSNDEIAKMLIEAGADVNYKMVDGNMSFPILTSTICKGNVNMVKFLLSQGANPNCERKNKDKRYSALRDSIALWPNNDIVEILVSSGATCREGELQSQKMSKDGLSKETQNKLKSMGVIFSLF